jgi:hypothetical protein
MNRADERARQAIASRNRLEGYLFDANSWITDITEIVSDGLSWLSEQASEDREVYDEKFNEIHMRVSSLIEAMGWPRPAEEESL